MERVKNNFQLKIRKEKLCLFTTSNSFICYRFELLWIVFMKKKKNYLKKTFWKKLQRANTRRWSGRQIPADSRESCTLSWCDERWTETRHQSKSKSVSTLVSNWTTYQINLVIQSKNNDRNKKNLQKMKLGLLFNWKNTQQAISYQHEFRL